MLIADLVVVQARLGEREAALGLADTCDAAAAHPYRRTFVADCVFARAEAEMVTGEPARAAALLADLTSATGQLPPLTPALLRLDPELDELRGRAEFDALR